MKFSPSEMSETNSKCFGYYTSQTTLICGPDATLECPFANSDAHPTRDFTEGEAELFQGWSASYPKSPVNGRAGTGLGLATAGCYIF